MPDQNTAHDVAAVLDAERRRCDAIRDRDNAALSAVLAEDLRYLHSTGDLEGKADYISTSIAGTPRSVTRGDLDVRIFSDIAVVIGDYEIRIEPDSTASQGRCVAASGLQVWRRADRRWLLWAHQGTEKR